MGRLVRAALLAALSAACVAGAATAQPAPPRLSGTVIGNGERRALFARPDGSFDSAAEGDRLDGYEVVRISPRSVWLRSAGGVLHLGLAEDAGMRVQLTDARPPAPVPEAARQAAEDNDR